MERLSLSVFRLRPWYHDFRALGVRTVFPAIPEPLRRLKAAALRRPPAPCDPEPARRWLNQRCKEPVLLDYCRRALAGVSAARPACLELFCADGYYGFHLKRLRPDARLLGIDRDGGHIRRAEAMARVLFPGDEVAFRQEDASRFVERCARDGERFDVVLCAGGLYHLDDPRSFVERLRPLVAGALVVQSVVTLATESPDYVAVPAPGWSHGSRFTHAALARWLDGAGFGVVDSARNELAGNDRATDRGSSYFLCRPS